jgi:uncharacterized protein YciI
LTSDFPFPYRWLVWAVAAVFVAVAEVTLEELVAGERDPLNLRPSSIGQRAQGGQMYFLVVNKPRAETDPKAIAEIVPAHIRWIEEQISFGNVVQAGKWGGSGGVVILRAENAQQAEALLQQDPVVQSGLFEIETGEFHPDVKLPRFD